MDDPEDTSKAALPAVVEEIVVGEALPRACKVRNFDDLAKNLAGVSLRVAVIQHVLSNPENEVYVGPMGQGFSDPFFQNVFGPRRVCWPVKCETYDFARLWHPNAQIVGDCPNAPTPTPEIDEMASVLCRRYGFLIGALSAGKIIAWGIHSRGVELTAIPRIVWLTPTTYVDFHTNTVGDWTVVELRLPTEADSASMNMTCASEIDLNDSGGKKNSGGREPEYPWRDYCDRLMIQTMQRGCPKTQAELIQWVQTFATEDGHKDIPRSTIQSALDRCLPKTVAHVRKEKKARKGDS